MAIILEKKKPFDLTKKTPGLVNVNAGLAWDVSVVNGVGADCDVSVFMLGTNNKIPSEGFFVFYNNLQSEDGAVRHTGDSREGEGDGDDETIEIDLPRIDARVVQLLFVVTIHEAEARGHHFGHVSKARIRLSNRVGGQDLCEYSLTEQFTGADSVVIARLYRDGSDWKAEALGEAFEGGLGTLVELYT